MTSSEIAQHIKQKCQISGNFKLRSGLTTNVYFDKYQFESDPQLLYEICLGLQKLVPAETEILAGLELGGVAIATVLSQITKLPCCFVRKKGKEYGTAKIAEGIDIVSKNVLVIEDIVTTGGQIILSVVDLRGLGAKVIGALCIIDREQGGKEALLKNDVGLSSLYSKTELEKV